MGKRSREKHLGTTEEERIRLAKLPTHTVQKHVGFKSYMRMFKRESHFKKQWSILMHALKKSATRIKVEPEGEKK
jgi:hypothetical protein